VGLDRSYVLTALADLRHWVLYLKGLGPPGGEALRADLTLQLAFLHALQISIQILLDVGAHLLAGIGASPVSDYADVGRELAVAGLIEPALGERLVRMARFRNLIVHRYHEIDLDSTAANVAGGLADFELFASAVVAYLDRTPDA
jgi:uncharacterized protein YutE (UPF0331/DUF86 family)